METALAALTASGGTIADLRPVGGGCVSPVARVRTADGYHGFLKWDDGSLPAGLLAAEAEGLGRLARAAAVRVPEVIGSGAGWLLLEWLEPSSPTDRAWAALGRGLAELHRNSADSYGAEHDNFIGTLPQANGRAASWPEFWRERRLQPQLRQAAAAGHFDAAQLDRFDRWLDRIDTVLREAGEEGPSLLHGDLWRGNVHFTGDGEAALVDPSVYHGHREVDLAMAELFGGFPPVFFDAYAGAWPLREGYEPVRRAAYQLYYLLVHVNLFGESYVSGALRALAEAGG